MDWYQLPQGLKYLLVRTVGGGVHLKPATLREFQDAGSEGIIQVSVRLTAGENVSEGAFDQ